MTDTLAFEAVTGPQRDRWGRPLIIPPGGGKPVAYQRCTSYISVLEDTYNLSQWQQRMVAVGLARRPDLQLQAASLAVDPEANKRGLNELTKSAMEAASASASATIGTALHALTERIDRGLDVGVVPDAYRPHLDAYVSATKALAPVHCEIFTVHDDLQIGGTPDRIVRVAGADGLFVADVKTGNLIGDDGKIAYGALKIAMQMAVYSHSVPYDATTGARTPIDGLRTDKGVLIALSAKTGDCELRWVDLNQGWAAVQTATAVREWRKREKTIIAPFEPVAAPVDTLAEVAIDNAIGAAASVEELLQLWAAADAKGAWTDAHTAAAVARKAAIEQASLAAVGAIQIPA